MFSEPYPNVVGQKEASAVTVTIRAPLHPVVANTAARFSQVHMYDKEMGAGEFYAGITCTKIQLSLKI